MDASLVTLALRGIDPHAAAASIVSTAGCMEVVGKLCDMLSAFGDRIVEIGTERGEHLNERRKEAFEARGGGTPLKSHRSTFQGWGRGAE